MSHDELFLEGMTTELVGEDWKMARYRPDPILFFDEVLGVRPETIVWSEYGGPYATHSWDGTINPLAKICDTLARRQRDVGVESGTGTGKTYLLALLVLWWLACWKKSKVATIAPKSDQLKKHMWAEIRGLWPAFKRRFPNAELLTLEVRMDPLLRDKWAATGYPVGVGAGEEVATKAQGWHAEHMLIIIEEGPGVPEAVYAAVEQTCIAPHNLRIAVGNPNHRLDPLHKFCSLPEVEHVRISALDHPNVVMDDAGLIPGAVFRRSINRREARWGRGSRMFMSRVRGISPRESADSLIRVEWLQHASEMWDDPSERRRLAAEGPPALGVDVADSPMGDEAAIVYGKGAAMDGILTKRCNANKLADHVLAEARSRNVDEKHTGVDAVGVGAGTINSLKDDKFRAQALHGQGAAKAWSGEEAFVNLRSQMWYQARLDLMHARVAVPEDDELWADLTTPEFEIRGKGKIYVESKKDIRRRLGRSPNKGDAFVYWNWVRQRRGGFSGEGGTQATF